MKVDFADVYVGDDLEYDGGDQPEAVYSNGETQAIWGGVDEAA